MHKNHVFLQSTSITGSNWIQPVVNSMNTVIVPTSSALWQPAYFGTVAKHHVHLIVNLHLEVRGTDIYLQLSARTAKRHCRRTRIL